jgi:hypothetical protein
VSWLKNDIREYTVTINSADDIVITNLIGDTESIRVRANEDIRTILLPDILNSVNFSIPERTLKYSQLTQSYLSIGNNSPLSGKLQAVRISPT